MWPLAYALGDSSPSARDAYRATLARNLLLTHTRDEVLQAFGARGIAAQPLKGALFLETLYGGDLGARPMSDLDILVRPEARLRATAALVDRGFERVGLGQARYAPENSHHTVFQRNGVPLELHHSLCRFPGVDDAGAPFFDQSVEIEARGQRWRVARREQQLYFTLLHAGMHGFLHRVGWIVDAVLLTRQSAPLHWDDVAAIAKRAHALRLVETSARMVNQWFPGTLAQVPPLRGSRDRLLSWMLARTTTPLRSPTLRSVMINLLSIERGREVAPYVLHKAALRTRELLERSGIGRS